MIDGIADVAIMTSKGGKKHWFTVYYNISLEGELLGVHCRVSNESSERLQLF